MKKIIHQIWLGKNPFPEIAEPWRASFKEFLPDWEYRLWTDDEIKTLEKNALCPHLMFDESIGMGIRPDVIRCEILRQVGGLYLDHDMELFRPLDEIIADDCVHFGYELANKEMIGTAILASPHGHPFWEFHLRRLRATVNPVRPNNPWDVVSLTGPNALKKSIHQWLADNFTCKNIVTENDFIAGHIFEHGEMIGWSNDAVFPYYFLDKRYEDFRIEDYPNAYAAHHWQGEWFREDREAKAKEKCSCDYHCSGH